MDSVVNELKKMVDYMQAMATSDGAPQALRRKAAKVYGDLSGMLSIAMREQAKAMSASLKPAAAQ